MSAAHRVRVLLVRSWTAGSKAIARCLQAAGLDVEITRVDLEPALNAALEREAFDIVVFDAASVRLSRATIDACLHAHHSNIPVIELAGLDELGDTVRGVLAASKN